MTMSAEQILEKASPLARRFRALFVERLGHLGYTEEFSDRYELAIAAPHPDVGELRVRDDGDELTISLGPHHWHVPEYMFDGETEARRPDLAAEAAVEDVRGVVEGRTVLRVARRNGRIGSTMTYDPDAHVPPLAADETEYTWTGPRKAP